ncbi:MAG: acyl carrier protein [Nitrospirae bacterium]|nr:acyl carrier protein [Nitrospirota bacterium]
MFDEVEQQVRKIIAEELQLDEQDIRKDASIAELGGDSLKSLMIISALENHYDITISDEEAAGIKTFKGAVDVVGKLIKQ